MVQIPSPKLTAKFTPENQELEDEVAFWNGSFWGGHVNIHALRKKCSYHRLLISSIWSSCSLKPCRSSWWDLWSCNILCRICTCSACIPGSHQSAAKSSCWHSSSARNPCSEWRPCPCHSLNFWPSSFSNCSTWRTYQYVLQLLEVQKHLFPPPDIWANCYSSYTWIKGILEGFPFNHHHLGWLLSGFVAITMICPAKCLVLGCPWKLVSK